ncbi:glycosyltransferase [Paragemmobacter straminiformis]|uniref:Glycosyltransferase n=1 Tax=Paragemmobacter straminiformis TaxID=2045119 RepID=A0A842IEP1_9RHOB|nr:glycosyltransferase [Gemmobacter straminiformis]MBC2837663.1 glycosyltransferase [Gemmobacter straminiformis]
MAPTPLSPLPQPKPRAPDGLAEATGLFIPAPPSPARILRPAPRDPLSTAPDTALALRFGLSDCLDLGVLPWAQAGAETLVLAQSPLHLSVARSRLAATFGPFLRPVETTAAQMEAALFTHFGPALAQAAETRVCPQESCRSLDARRLRRSVIAVAGALLVLSLAAPLAVFSLAFALATLALSVTTAFKFATSLATLRADASPPPPPLPDADLPTVTLLIALFHEADIADRLIRRLERIDYPRDLLELILVVEDDDHATRRALATARLPAWMRVISAPAGSIRTKPRALNLALGVARGEVVGVYDAEDAPEPGQLRKVAAAFAAAPPHIACIQAMLDFYNPRKNWLARCFTLEYALWFRLVLPGLERLRLPIPLGGTSVFLRRDTLRALGGWDAHNVTEDADLGIRLARHGFGTRMIQSTTYEEANCRALPWVRQRSRWIKGYMMTWLVHMRSPRALWRQLGPRGFLGFQIVFLGALAQVLLVPLLWTLWSIPLGLGHPLAQVLPSGGLTALATLFLGAEAIGSLLSLIALRRSGQRISALWIPTLHLYFPLGTLAALKAFRETLTAPYYWDKTRHGQFHD